MSRLIISLSILLILIEAYYYVQSRNPTVGSFIF